MMHNLYQLLYPIYWATWHHSDTTEHNFNAPLNEGFKSREMQIGEVSYALDVYTMESSEFF